MSEIDELVDRFTTVMSGPSDENIADLAEFLHDDIKIVGMLGGGDDKETVLKTLNNPMATMLFGAADWPDPDVNGDKVTLTAKLPAGAPLAGMVFELTLDSNGKITQVLEEMIPAPKPVATKLQLTAEIKDQVNGALDAGTPITWAYLDEQGSIHMAPRGSTQAFSDDQLAIWLRDRVGGMTKAVASNPSVGAFLRSMTNGMMYQFAGRARVDESANDTVYGNAPAAEQTADPRRKGIALIIDLDRVEGLGPSGRFIMERDA